MKTLIAILILFTAVAVYTDTRAAEWNQKPVICAQCDIVKAGLQERGEILMVNARQTTTVSVSYTHLTLPTTPYV